MTVTIHLMVGVWEVVVDSDSHLAVKLCASQVAAGQLTAVPQVIQCGMNTGRHAVAYLAHYFPTFCCFGYNSLNWLYNFVTYGG